MSLKSNERICGNVLYHIESTCRVKTGLLLSNDYMLFLIVKHKTIYNGCKTRPH